LAKNTEIKKIQIIVVDNNSSDGSREMIRSLFPEVILINSGSNIGFGRANNLAIPYINSEIILFLNPDTLIFANTLPKMVEFLKENPNAGALSCKLRYNVNQLDQIGVDNGAHTLGIQWFPSPLTEFISFFFVSDKSMKIFKKFLPYQDPNKSGYIIKLYGTAFMVKKEVLNKVGYFDERFFMYGEDVDLSRRIINAGWKLYYMSEVEIVHVVGGASKTRNKDFAVLMKCESIYKFIEKYNGNFGKVFYKFIVACGSNFRLMLLFTKYIFSSADKKKRYNEQIKKYKSIFRWSINKI